MPSKNDYDEVFKLEPWSPSVQPMAVEHYFKQIEFYDEEADDGEEGDRGPNSQKP